MAAKKQTLDDVVEPTPIPVEKPKRDAGYHVKEGCSVISKRKGVLSSDDGKLDPDWFTGGKDTLDKLVKSGQIEKV